MYAGMTMPQRGIQLLFYHNCHEKGIKKESRKRDSFLYLLYTLEFCNVDRECIRTFYFLSGSDGNILVSNQIFHVGTCLDGFSTLVIE